MSDMSYPTKENSQFMNVQGGEKKVMKKILSVALSTAMAFSMFASVAFGETATTPQEKFDALAAKGILNGYPDGQSHLEKDLTRAEFAKILTKLFNLTEVTGKLSYNDAGYTATNWGVPYIEAVTEAGLMEGKDTVKGIFDYNGKVTVEEVAAVLVRALDLETPDTTDNNASTWAKGYAQAVIDAGLVAQNTVFTANATRSLVVETAYAVDQLLSVPAVTVASAEALSTTEVLVTFSDDTTTTVELTTALVAGVETTINFTHQEKDYTAKVTLASPKVVSVSAPNAKEVVVKFNRAIDVDTLVDSDDSTLLDDVLAITLVGSGKSVTKAQVDASSVVLANNGTEAWITLPSSLYLDGQYTVVLDDVVQTTDGETIPAYTTLLSVDDTTAPEVTAVSSTAKTTTTKVYVTLSEPVKTSGAIARVNGVSATVSRSTYDPLNQLTLTTTTLTSGATYDVSLTNVADYAGNYTSTNPYTTTVTVNSDTAAPTITNVDVTDEFEVTVTFDKAIKYSTLVGNVRLLDANGASKGYFSVTATSDPKVFVFKRTFNFGDASTFAGTMYFGATVADTVGNTLGTAVTQAVTFTEDNTAPEVLSASYNSSKGIVLKFSEKVNLVTSVSGIRLINDATGASTSIPTAGSSTNSGKTWTIPASIATGSYTLRLPSGVFVDKSSNANSLAASVVSLTTTTSTTDVTAPSVTSDVYVDQTERYIQFTVTDNEELDISTVINANSYILNDEALPSAAYITTSGYSSSNPTTAVVSVYLPKSILTYTGDYELAITGIADAAGNLIDTDLAASTKKAYFIDSVSPTFESVAVTSGDSTILALTFDEQIKASSFKLSDFTFYKNADEVLTPIAGQTVTWSADKTTAYVTFDESLTASTVYSVSVYLKDGATLTDEYDNTINDDVTIYAD